MKYATEAAFRAALEARFLKLAGPNNDKQLVRFRKMVAYERLLGRLVVVAPDQWVVKGGLALEFRFGDRSRATLDAQMNEWQADPQNTPLGMILTTEGADPMPCELDAIYGLKSIPNRLRARGYSESDIEKIMHGNWLRMLERVWTAQG